MLLAIFLKGLFLRTPKNIDAECESQIISCLLGLLSCQSSGSARMFPRILPAQRSDPTPSHRKGLYALNNAFCGSYEHLLLIKAESC